MNNYIIHHVMGWKYSSKLVWNQTLSYMHSNQNLGHLPSIGLFLIDIIRLKLRYSVYDNCYLSLN